MTKQDDSTRTPTTKEIATRPRWARVAFAARCARRVVPLFQTSPRVSRSAIVAVQHVIDLAEVAAVAAFTLGAVTGIIGNTLPEIK